MCLAQGPMGRPGSAPDFFDAITCMLNAGSRQSAADFSGAENHYDVRLRAPFEVPQHDPSPMPRHVRMYMLSEWPA